MARIRDDVTGTEWISLTASSINRSDTRTTRRLRTETGVRSFACVSLEDDVGEGNLGCGSAAELPSHVTVLCLTDSTVPAQPWKQDFLSLSGWVSTPTNWGERFFSQGDCCVLVGKTTRFSVHSTGITKGAQRPCFHPKAPSI